MRKEKHLLALAFAILISLSGCGGNPAWNGPEDSEDKLTKAAEQTCECIYETIDREEAHDVGDVIEQLAKWEKALAGEQVPANEVEEVTKLMARVPPIAETVDNGTCMQAVEEDLFNKGLDFDDMLDILDKHCVLAMFYD